MIRSRGSIIIAGAALAASLALPSAAFALGSYSELISLDSYDVQSNGISSWSSITDDGRYAAFQSTASNLVAGDTNGASDVFVRDRDTSATSRVSVSSVGVEGTGDSLTPDISGNARYVLYASIADNLTSGDANFCMDILQLDRLTGITSRLTHSAAGGATDGNSYTPRISRDGRFVVFTSIASNLVAGDANGLMDVFVWDRTTGVITRASFGVAGAEPNGDCRTGDISDDGRFVSFESDASNLVPEDTNTTYDVFVRDRLNNTTSRVSVSSAGVQAGDLSSAPRISGDGRYVAFQSAASNLVASDNNASWDVFVRDRGTSQTLRMSVNGSDTEGDSDSRAPVISADGRFVAFESRATNLVYGDTNGQSDIFIRDRSCSTAARSSFAAGDANTNGDSREVAITSDGGWTTFDSVANNIIVPDANLTWDVFTHQDCRPASIAIKTDQTTRTTGQIATLSGAVEPVSVVGRIIVVYVKKPGKTYWTYSSNRMAYSLSGAGAWQYKYRFVAGMTKGTYVYKAFIPPYPGLLTATSPSTVSVRLR